MSAFEGIIPILATPFHDDESLDLESWRRLLEFMIDLGVHGVTILGVLGESNRLNDHEREELIQSAVATVKKRVPIIVGTSHSGTRAAKHLSQMAQNLAADAVMVMAGKEPVPNDDRIVEFYQRVADGLTIPIVLQDHPASSEVHLSVPLMLRLLREVPAIQCIKEEAVPTAPKIRQLHKGLGERRLPILTGLGALYAPFDLEAGSDGFNTGFAFPEVLDAMFNAARGSILLPALFHFQLNNPLWPDAQPYDTWVDGEDNVWVSDGGQGGTLIKFDPKTEKWTYYPSPQFTDMPKLAIGGNGAIWYCPRSSSNAGVGVLYPDMSKITTLAAQRPVNVMR